jgi:hypothetical protein
MFYKKFLSFEPINIAKKAKVDRFLASIMLQENLKVTSNVDFTQDSLEALNAFVFLGIFDCSISNFKYRGLSVVEEDFWKE